MSKYGKIPKKILNIQLGDNYFNGPYTVKDELDRYNEIILDHKYHLVQGSLYSFHAWSKNLVFVLMDDVLSPEEKLIVAIPRNPPTRKKK